MRSLPYFLVNSTCNVKYIQRETFQSLNMLITLYTYFIDNWPPVFQTVTELVFLSCYSYNIFFSSFSQAGGVPVPEICGTSTGLHVYLSAGGRGNTDEISVTHTFAGTANQRRFRYTVEFLLENMYVYRSRNLTPIHITYFVIL